MRSGFTLIEVLVAVAILSVAAAAILNLGIQSAKLGDRLKQKEALFAPMSVAALHGKTDHSNTNRTLESLLGGSYKIEHEGLKNYLKSREIHYQENRLGSWDLVPEGIDSFGDLPRFEIIERIVTFNDRQGRLYAIRPER
ncbi:MAG: prepilin-type N-terminal cleavage/methylation domain-containing protein [Campylobacterales bacterium]